MRYFDYNWNVLNVFSKEKFDEMIRNFANSKLSADELIGQVRCGNLCFDVIVREYDELFLTFDLYVGGVDTGYGYSVLIKDYPYDYADGDSIASMQEISKLDYGAFVSIAEFVFDRFINNHEETYKNSDLAANNASLCAIALEPIKIW